MVFRGFPYGKWLHRTREEKQPSKSSLHVQLYRENELLKHQLKHLLCGVLDSVAVAQHASHTSIPHLVETVVELLVARQWPACNGRLCVVMFSRPLQLTPVGQ